MADPIGSITAVAANDSAAGSKSAPKLFGEGLVPSAPSNEGRVVPEAFQNFVERFQASGARFERAGADTGISDPVQSAKADLALNEAQSVQINTPGTAGAEKVTAKAAANESLRKSFDHAVFVTLVSQVVSGVSQATTTLVRQQ